MECRKVFSSTIHSKPLPVWLWSTTTIYCSKEEWLRNPSSMKSLNSTSSKSLSDVFELGHPAVEILSKWLPQSSYSQINTSHLLDNWGSFFNWKQLPGGHCCQPRHSHAASDWPSVHCSEAVLSSRWLYWPQLAQICCRLWQQQQ